VRPTDRVILRREHPRERSGVRSLNEAAFGRPDEADLIDRLRTEGAVLASFVAECEQRIVGHILFSRMLIETGQECYPRFGFSSDRARSLASPFPAQAFMALELLPGALDGVRGRVRYADAFGLQSRQAASDSPD
jgi:putative acetyltransferase